MRPRSSETRRGITIVELLVVLMIIGMLFVLLAPAIIQRHDGSIRVKCMSNQKQIVLANLLWMTDNTNRFPWQVPIAEEGSLEYTNQVLPHFQILSNYMRAPMVYTCPTDTRTPTNTYAWLSRTNLSYFLNLDASTNQTATTILSGDRHLALGGQPVSPGSFLLRGNAAVSWTRELHNSKLHKLGMVSFADGHVEAIMDGKLSSAIGRQPLGTNRLVVP